MVELVVALPLLLFILLLAADFGRVFYAALTLANAARAGALYGAQSNDKSGDADGMVSAATQEALNLGPITVATARFCECPGGAAVDCLTGSCPIDDYGEPRVFVQVTANFTFRTVVSYPAIPDTIPLSRTAILRVQ